MNIDLKPVTSSNIAAIGHDPDSNTLAVRFMPRAGSKWGDVWHYEGVSAKQHEALLKAESVGKHFSAHIRGKFTGRQIKETS